MTTEEAIAYFDRNPQVTLVRLPRDAYRRLAGDGGPVRADVAPLAIEVLPRTTAGKALRHYVVSNGRG